MLNLTSWQEQKFPLCVFFHRKSLTCDVQFRRKSWGGDKRRYEIGRQYFPVRNAQAWNFKRYPVFADAMRTCAPKIFGYLWERRVIFNGITCCIFDRGWRSIATNWIDYSVRIARGRKAVMDPTRSANLDLVFHWMWRRSAAVSENSVFGDHTSNIKVNAYKLWCYHLLMKKILN